MHVRQGFCFGTDTIHSTSNFATEPSGIQVISVRSYSILYIAHKQNKHLLLSMCFILCGVHVVLMCSSLRAHEFGNAAPGMSLLL
ncbi:hypothetical protein GDO86_008305 [Hymenochirus boettgeri]|uniref:Uncharacterized protein n=1 Tax=Hymenochirus boettgeri TaxID=247094 RepID=A0A8T2IZW2_9PIPI|nr:hypothetical protein GDO86_008305 [Hymenochirus boettgeri]